ncbi:MAG: ATP synthase subunit I [Acidobacteriota bacterium]
MPASQMSTEDDSRVQQRLQRHTYVVIILALIVGGIWAGWPMALGILLGGILSLFNKRWLQGSLRAMLNHVVAQETGRVPPFTASKFILRYFVIALVIGMAVWTGKVHPLGLGIGFAAFVGGVMIEAGYQLYLGFKTNDEAVSEEASDSSSKE